MPLNTSSPVRPRVVACLAALALCALAAHPVVAGEAPPAAEKPISIVATLLELLGLDDDSPEAQDAEPDDDGLPSMGFEIEPNG